ncbi:MAG: Holliday junction resolvase-like protein [Spirochaetales bacterium]|uniref:Holliday junction resolvase-like protein n=1 Tax=Candidatus Thalassospirochaeta sargassi TaxID=3119039 RepID=A0AAJ1IDR2_9SPIO|nr:Holliday junction resolvase-like protein [Spirochaetales bacterium]
MNINQDLIIILLAALVAVITAFRLGRRTGRRAEERDWERNKLEVIVRDRIKRSRAVLGGQFAEQLAPFLPDFPYNPNECRFIGKPIDLLVFKGMDDGRIDEVVLVEIKSGKAKNLSGIERQLRDAINNGRVSWQQYDVPDRIVENKG